MSGSTDPDRTDPDGTDPPRTGPDGTEPDGIPPERTDPGRAQPDGTLPERTDPASTAWDPPPSPDYVPPVAGPPVPYGVFPGYGQPQLPGPPPVGGPPPPYGVFPGYGQPLPPGPPPAFGQPPPYGQPPAYGSQPPAYGSQPPYAAGPYAAPGAFEAPKQNVSAIVLTITAGVLSVLCCSLLTLPALIFGIVGLSKQSTDPEGSARMTRYGWIAFGVGLLVSILAIIGFFALGAGGYLDDSGPYDGY